MCFNLFVNHSNKYFDYNTFPFLKKTLKIIAILCICSRFASGLFDHILIAVSRARSAEALDSQNLQMPTIMNICAEALLKSF